MTVETVDAIKQIRAILILMRSDALDATHQRGLGKKEQSIRDAYYDALTDFERKLAEQGLIS